MQAAELAAANALLAEAQDVDLSVSQRLGLHVVVRLGARHGVSVSLGATLGSGTTAVVALPATVFSTLPAVTEPTPVQQAPAGRAVPGGAAVHPQRRPDLPQTTQPISAVRRGSGDRARHTDTVPVAALPGLEIGPVDVGAVEVTAAIVAAGVSVSEKPVSIGAEQSWLGWWEPEPEACRDSTVSVVPSPRPRPTPDPFVTPFAAPPSSSRPAVTPAPATGSAAATRQQVVEPPPIDATIGLRRRVPQAHLAPELREPVAGPEPARQVVPSQVSDAASALSRYQASRQTAQTAVDGENGRRP
jgi:hypothetical protein